MYQGSTADFTVFDRKKSRGSNLYGRGFYFTADKNQAKIYGEAKPYYLNIEHPLSPGQHNISKAQMRKFLEAVFENDDEYSPENYGENATVDSVLKSVFGKGDFEMIQDVNATAIGDMVAAVELFNEVNGTEYDGLILEKETVIFNSEQAKNIDNLNPTENPDVRFSTVLRPSAQQRNRISAEEASKPITLADIRALQSIGRKSINDFSEADIVKAQKWAYRFYQQLGLKSPFFRAWFGEWRAHSIMPANIVSFAYGENGRIDKRSRSIKNEDTGFDVKIDGTIFGDSYHYAAVHNEKSKITKLLGKLDEIIEKATLFDTRLSESGKSEKKGGTSFMHYLYTPVTINGAPFIAKLEIEEYGPENSRRAYNLQRIEMSEVSRAQFSQILEENREKYAYTSDALTVAQLYDFVKKKDNKISYAKPVNQNLLNKDGTPKRLWHQTAVNIEEFRNDNPGAGKTDSETPNGFFAKDNNHDIGLEGKKQMPIFMTMQNPLHFANRKEANAWYCKNVDGYENLQDEMESKIKPIDQEMDRLEDEMFGEDVDGAKYEKLNAEWDKKRDEMEAIENDYRGRLRGLLNDYFLNRDSGYDGIILDYDAHRYVNGKRENVKTYIAFKNTQIKSATENIGTFDKSARVKTSTVLSRDSDLVAANRQLRKDLSELRAKLNTRTAQKEYWKGQTKTTDGRRARLDDAKKLARTLAKEHGSKIDVDVVGAKLKDLADFCLNEREFDDAFYEEARMRTYEIAHMILDDSEILRDEMETDFSESIFFKNLGNS